MLRSCEGVSEGVDAVAALRRGWTNGHYVSCAGIRVARGLRVPLKVIQGGCGAEAREKAEAGSGRARAAYTQLTSAIPAARSAVFFAVQYQRKSTAVQYSRTSRLFSRYKLFWVAPRRLARHSCSQRASRPFALSPLSLSFLPLTYVKFNSDHVPLTTSQRRQGPHSIQRTRFVSPAYSRPELVRIRGRSLAYQGGRLRDVFSPQVLHS